MFCSGCGTELEAGLNFCKRCGKALGAGDISKVAFNLTNALGAIGVFGFIGFAAMLYLLLRSPIIPPGTILGVAGLYLATLFGICYLILRQMGIVTSRSSGRAPDRENGDSMPAYLKPASTDQLLQPADEPISIAEHTTRDLDAIPVRRK